MEGNGAANQGGAGSAIAPCAKRTDAMEYRDGEYFLTSDESDILFRQSIHPDETVMRRRNRFFAEIDRSLQITYLENGEMVVSANAESS